MKEESFASQAIVYNFAIEKYFVNTPQMRINNSFEISNLISELIDKIMIITCAFKIKTLNIFAF